MAKPLYFGIFFVTAIIFNKCSALQCNQKNSCECDFDEYSQINLTHLLPSATKKFLFDTEGNYTYFYSGCKDAEFDPKSYNLNSTLKEKASLIKCIETKYVEPVIINGTNLGYNFTYVVHNCTVVGYENQIKFVTPNDLPNNVQLIYNVKEGSAPCINLVCDSFNRTDLKIADYASNTLTVYSPLVCTKYIQHHELSTGSIFCILFFTAAIIYFVGGGLLMYTARGARGVEVIPNFDFWASLPGLIKDGTIFILSGCRPFTVSTAETYDRI